MKRNIKKIIPMVAIAALMATSVYANNNVVATQPEATASDLTPVEAKENQIFVNGELLDASLIKENGKTLIPVRTIFEKLGFTISYDANTKIITMVKGAQYITFDTTNDAYTFAKMAPQPLGQAPVVKEGTTYVPVELFDLMGMEVQLTENNVLYVGEEVAATTINKKSQIIVTEINEENGTVTVSDDERGTVVLNIKDLEITSDTEETNIMVGVALDVEYGDVMTASLPPMNTPKSVKIVDKYSYGEVLSVEKDGENTRVLFNDETMGEVMLNISPELEVVYGTEDNEIKVGQTLEVVLGRAMTMSIPPMNNPKSVTVLAEINVNARQATEANATITSVDTENKTITVKDVDMGEVVLNLHDDVVIEYKNKVGLNAYNWMVEGQELQVEYSPVMTRSLPPINNPVKIVVLN